MYSELTSLLPTNGAQWVQFDEAGLVTDISPDAAALARPSYTALGSVSNRPAIHVATYFGGPRRCAWGAGTHARRADGECGRCRKRGCGHLGMSTKILVAGPSSIGAQRLAHTRLESALAKLAPSAGFRWHSGGFDVVFTMNVPYSWEARDGG